MDLRRPPFGSALYTLNRLDVPAGFLRARLMVGFQPYRHLSFYGGLTGTLLLDLPQRNRPDARPGYQYLTTRVDTTDVNVRGWPGFVVGFGF